MLNSATFLSLFHPIIEGFCIMVSILIFTQSLFSYRYHHHVTTNQLGLLFLTIAIYDVFHTITYNGTPYTTIHSDNSITYLFRLFARLSGSIGFFFIFLFKDQVNNIQHFPYRKIIHMFIMIAIVIVSILLVVFPNHQLVVMIITNLLYQEILLNGIVLFFELMGIILLTKYYLTSKDIYYLPLICALVLLSSSQITYISYSYILGQDALLGHLFKAVGYYFMGYGLYVRTLDQVYIEQKESKRKLSHLTNKLQNIKKNIYKTANKNVENERKRISQDLHDGVGQTLLFLLVEIHMLKNSNSKDDLTKQIAEIEDVVKQLMKEIKDISFQLRPAILDHVGLIPALETLVELIKEKYRINVLLNNYLKSTKFNSEVEHVLYRVCQESMTNSIKHAESNEINVTLSEDDNVLKLIIADNGKGFHIDSSIHKRGLGLKGMKERVTQLKGKFSIMSEIGRGTEVQIFLPKDTSK